MLFQRLYWGFICSFIIFGIFALYLNGKPLCIDSRTVEKIDMYSEGFRKETLFHCSQKRKSITQGYFIQEAQRLQARLQKVEKFLDYLEPTKSKMTITVLKEKPYFFVQKNGQLWIGQKLLESSGHLEKAIIRNWIQERWPMHFAHQTLTEEVIGDFLYYTLNGNVENEDLITQRRLQYDIQRWPQVIKSLQGYCHSPWRLSEHFAFCTQQNIFGFAMSSEALELGLRPLLSQSMISAYKKLGLLERFQVLRQVSDFIKMPHQPAPPLIKNSFLNFPGDNKMSSLQTVQEAAEIIRRFNKFILSSEAVKKSQVLRTFASYFNQELLRRNFQSNFEEIQFDLVYSSEGNMSPQVIEHFIRIQTLHPDLTIALTDQKHLWMIPNKDPLPLESFGIVKSHRGIVERCTSFNFKDVMTYSERFQRVLVVGACKQDFDRNYTHFMKEGARGFARQNPRATFVQFHMPSLMIKKDELIKVQDVFDLLKKREVSDPAFQVLGWQEIKWDQKINAYNPRAFVDAIEWFRDTGLRLKP